MVAKVIKEVIAKVIPEQLRTPTKGLVEYLFWWKELRKSGQLYNNHYEFFYTQFFSVDRQQFDKARVLDVGCGPAGSLEWADRARERVGLDPLVPRYEKLGISEHKMSYVASPAEQMPFSDNHFDVVASFNSLDHTEDPWRVLQEMRRVVKPGGLVLLIVEVNHKPTLTEPVTLDQEVLTKRIQDLFDIETLRIFDVPSNHNLYEGLAKGDPSKRQDHSIPGILAAKMRKKDGSAPAKVSA